MGSEEFEKSWKRVDNVKRRVEAQSRMGKGRVSSRRVGEWGCFWLLELDPNALLL